MGLFDFITDRFEDKDKQRERAARREARTAMELYKKQQGESEKLLNERKQQQAFEKRAINEKQIRSLRASYRRPGIMGTANQTQAAPAPAAGVMEQSAVGK